MQKSIINTSTVRLVSIISNFLIVLMIARWLGPTAKGITTSILTTATFVTFVAHIIGGQSFIYLFPRSNTNELFISAYLWTFIVSFGSVFLLAIFDFFPVKYSYYIGLVSFFSSIISIHSSYMLSQNKIKSYNTYYIVPVFLSVSITAILFFVVNYKHIDSYFYALIFSNIVVSVFSFLQTKKLHAFKLDTNLYDTAKKAIRYGLPHQLLELSQLLNTRFYYYTMLYLQDKTDLGYFSVGVSLFEVGWTFSRSAQSLVYSKLSQHHEDSVIQNMNHFFKFGFLFSGLLSLTLLLIPDLVFELTFGQYYIGINRSLKWFIPGLLAYNAYLIFNSYYLSKGKYSLLIILNLIGFLICTLSCFITIPTKFFSGAAFSVSLGFTFIAISITYFYLKETQQPISVLLPNKKDGEFINNLLKSAFKR